MELDTKIVYQNETGLEAYIYYYKAGSRIVTPRIESLNKFIGIAAQKNPFAYRNYATKWAFALRGIKQVKRVDKKGYLTVVTNRKRGLDKINRYGGVKPLEDILVNKGWLHDDTDKWCDLSVLQGHSKDEYTYIKLQY